MAVNRIECLFNGVVVSHMASTRLTHREEGEAKRPIKAEYHPHLQKFDHSAPN